MEKKLERAYLSLKKAVKNNYQREFGRKCKRFGKKIRAEFTEIIEESISQDILQNINREKAIDRICEDIYSGGLTIYQIVLNDYIGLEN